MLYSNDLGVHCRCPAEGYPLPHLNEEAIELAAMGRLHDAKLQQHLSVCASCTKRVAGHRAWISALKCALSLFVYPADVPAPRRNGAGRR